MRCNVVSSWRCLIKSLNQKLVTMKEQATEYKFSSLPHIPLFSAVGSLIVLRVSKELWGIHLPFYQK